LLSGSTANGGIEAKPNIKFKEVISIYLQMHL
jgi:hypothetical protein